MRRFLLVSLDLVALVKLPLEPDEAGGPPPQVLRITGHAPLKGDHVRIKFELTQQLRELSNAGFAVYAGYTQRIFEMNGHRSPWPGTAFKILRREDATTTERQILGRR
jgi:hypothetical protein